MEPVARVPILIMNVREKKITVSVEQCKNNEVPFFIFFKNS